MATSLISMLNRLPIYNRPKEPAIGINIGNPVLVETSNPNLGNLPNLPTPAKYDHFGNLVSPPSGSSSNPNSSKKLPPIPGQLDSSQVKVTPFRIPSPQNTTPSRSPPPSNANNVPNSQHQPTISRKPAPPGNSRFDMPEYNPPEGISYQSYDTRSYNNSGTAGRKKAGQGRVAPQIVPATSSLNHNGQPRLVKHQSIDDWVNKRQENPPPPPLKIYGRTSPPRTPRRDRTNSTSAEPPKLAIRQSVFAPFENPADRHEEVPSLPQIPTSTPLVPLRGSSRDPPQQSKIPQPESPVQSTRKYESGTTDLLKTLSESLNLTSIAEKEKTPEPTPKDHITELEETRDKLYARRISVNKDIFEMKQSLPAISSPDRGEVKERIGEKEQELADIEKEIFDTGMMIHRAWRRKVKKDGIEAPTHLWVHNVAARE